MFYVENHLKDIVIYIYVPIYAIYDQYSSRRCRSRENFRLRRFLGEGFSDTYMTTLGKTTEVVTYQGRKLIFHDIGGYERFLTSTDLYYSIAHGAIVFYDQKNARIQYWVDKENTLCCGVTKVDYMFLLPRRTIYNLVAKKTSLSMPFSHRYWKTCYRAHKRLDARLSMETICTVASDSHPTIVTQASF